MGDALKWLIRLFSTKNWRGHKRKVFFSKMLYRFTNAEDGFHGIINYHDDFTYGLVCHEMAANIPYYPFEKNATFEIQEYLNLYTKHNYKKVIVTIKRNKGFWESLTGNGCYTVTVEGIPPCGKNEKYCEKIELRSTKESS